VVIGNNTTKFILLYPTVVGGSVYNVYNADVKIENINENNINITGVLAKTLEGDVPRANDKTNVYGVYDVRSGNNNNDNIVISTNIVTIGSSSGNSKIYGNIYGVYAMGAPGITWADGISGYIYSNSIAITNTSVTGDINNVYTNWKSEIGINKNGNSFGNSIVVNFNSSGYSIDGNINNIYITVNRVGAVKNNLIRINNTAVGGATIGGTIVNVNDRATSSSCAASDDCITNNVVELILANILSVGHNISNINSIASGNISSNKINISGSLIMSSTADANNDIYGVTVAGAGSSKIYGNEININSDSTIEAIGNSTIDIYGIYDNRSGVETAIYDNKIVINGSVISGDIYGIDTGTNTGGNGTGNTNTISISGSMIYGNIYNIKTSKNFTFGNDGGNVMDINNSIISGNIINIEIKGTGSGYVRGNKILIKSVTNTSSISGSITNISTSTGGDIIGNVLDFNLANTNNFSVNNYIYNIYSIGIGMITENELIIANGTLKMINVNDDIYGVYAKDGVAVTNQNSIAKNKITIADSIISMNEKTIDIYGIYDGRTGTPTNASIEENIITINNSVIKANIRGVNTGTASIGGSTTLGNLIDINNSTITGDLINIDTARTNEIGINNPIDIYKNANILSINNSNINGNITNIKKNVNGTGGITNNKLNITNTMNSRSIVGYIYNVSNIGSGSIIGNVATFVLAANLDFKVNNNIININSTGTSNINNNILNISGKLIMSSATIANRNIYGVNVNSTSGNLTGNKINLVNANINVENIYGIYSAGTVSSRSIITNEININNANINGNIYGIYNTSSTGIVYINGTTDTNFNKIIIENSTINGDIYGVYSTTALSSTSTKFEIFIKKNSVINGNIYGGYSYVGGTGTVGGINNCIIINTDLSYMSDNNKGIYAGVNGTSSYVMFVGKDIRLIDNSIIKNSPTIVLSNITRNLSDNYGISQTNSSFIIDRQLNYTGSSIELNKDIMIRLSLDNMSDNGIFITASTISGAGGTTIDKGIELELMSINSDIRSIILFNATTIGSSINKDSFYFEEDLYIKDIGKINNQIIINFNKTFYTIASETENTRKLNSFGEAMDNANVRMSSGETNKEKYKDNDQKNLLKSFMRSINVDDELSKDGEKFLESFMKSWLPELGGAIYQGAKSNFQHISSKVNGRLDRAFDNFNRFKYSDYISKSKDSAYNYLLTKNLEENSEIFDYNYLPMKTKRQLDMNWFDVSMSTGSQKGNNFRDSFKTQNSNFLYGRETIYDKKKINGMVVSFNSGKIETDLKKIQTVYISGALYSRYNFTDTFFVNGIISYSFNNYEENSTPINYGTVKDIQFKSTYRANQVSGGFATGLDAEYIVTKIGLNYTMVNVDPYIDNYENSISKNDYNSMTGTFGVTLKNFGNILKNHFITIKPQIFIEIGAGIIEPTINVNGALNENSGYKISGDKIDESFAHYGLNINMEFVRTFTVDIDFDQIIRNDYSNMQVGMKFNFMW
jgi:hypothetical protein